MGYTSLLSPPSWAPTRPIIHAPDPFTSARFLNLVRTQLRNHLSRARLRRTLNTVWTRPAARSNLAGYERLARLRLGRRGASMATFPFSEVRRCAGLRASRLARRSACHRAALSWRWGPSARSPSWRPAGVFKTSAKASSKERFVSSESASACRASTSTTISDTVCSALTLCLSSFAISPPTQDATPARAAGHHANGLVSVNFALILGSMIGQGRVAA